MEREGNAAAHISVEMAREALGINYRREVEEIAGKIRPKMSKRVLADDEQITDEILKWMQESPRSWQERLVIETLLCTKNPLKYLSGPLTDPPPTSPFFVIAQAANDAFFDDIMEAVMNHSTAEESAPPTESEGDRE